jgi:integrase
MFLYLLGRKYGRNDLGVFIGFYPTYFGKTAKRVGKMKRVGTGYPGVFYRMVRRRGTKNGELERMYYIFYKKGGRVHEEKVGRASEDNLTPYKVSQILRDRLAGRRPSRKEKREAERKRVTVDSLWAAYDKNQERKDKVNDKSRYGKYIKPYFGKKEPREVLPLDIERFKREGLKGKAPATVRNVLELLRRLLNYGAKKGLCPPLPFKIDMGKLNNERTEDLTPEEVTRLLKIARKDKHPVAGDLMRMALFTGMRRSELLRLQWQDIDFQRGFISIKNPKSGVNATIPLNDVTRDLLQARKRKGPYVFASKNGKPYVDLRKAINAIKEKAELPPDFRPVHGLRHVYASMLASSGRVEMYHLQKLLTHKSGRMTARYAHLRDSALKEASNVISELVRKAVEE